MRIFHAVTSKYHRKSGSNTEWVCNMESPSDQKNSTATNISGNDALIETAVKTGLSLVFSLLKHNWAISSALSAQLPATLGASTLCNDVLLTALDVIKELPALSLSNESKISALAMSTLQQVTSFLTSTTTSQNG